MPPLTDDIFLTVDPNTTNVYIEAILRPSKFEFCKIAHKVSHDTVLPIPSSYNGTVGTRSLRGSLENYPDGTAELTLGRKMS